MINTDYPVEAIGILLNEDCLLERYYPLVAYKEKLICGLKNLGCASKSDVSRVSDAELLNIGLPDLPSVGLFRRFLCLYDPKPQKFREIAKLVADPSETGSFTELCHLPGVKYTRAALYRLAGYTSLKTIAEATEDELLAKTSSVIAENGLTCAAPLPKEVRTHIAVAKAFTKT